MLPEVRQRQEEMRKKAAAAINRMNMKLYQQVMEYSIRAISVIGCCTIESASQHEKET